jgi:DNA-binding transcriptional LysR family regulator
MTDLEIEVFLAICKYRNMSKAAEKLFMSQSSLSERLKSLETKLGFMLLQRNRGNRAITLTQEGRVFYEFALQRQEITRKMYAVGESSQTIRLRIGSLSSIGNFLLPLVYQRFSQKYPKSEFKFYHMNGVTAYMKLSDQEVDLAFSTNGERTNEFTAIPLVSEPMEFICTVDSDYPDVVEHSMLSTKDEIYSRWSYDFERWHHSFFGSDPAPMLRTQYLDRFWPCVEDRPNTWAIVPRSLAVGLCDATKVRQCQMAFSVPPRMIFAHTINDPDQNENIFLFLQCFRELLQERDFGLLL